MFFSNQNSQQLQLWDDKIESTNVQILFSYFYLFSLKVHKIHRVQVYKCTIKITISGKTLFKSLFFFLYVSKKPISVIIASVR